MPLLQPTLYLHRIYQLSPEQLKEWGVTTLVLDVDNTLTTHDNPEPDRRVLEWIRLMKKHGITLVILSNNKKERVHRFAGKLGMDYTARAMKPLKKGFRETARRLGVSPREMAVVGDQIYTDILGGNLYGIRTVLVEPMAPDTHPGIRLKRILEKPVLRHCKNKPEDSI